MPGRNLTGAQQKARAEGLKAQQTWYKLPTAGEKEFIFDSFQVRQVKQGLQLQLKLPENHTLDKNLSLES